MKAQVVSFHCVLRNHLGQVLSTSINQNVLTVDRPDNSALKGLTEGLQNIKKGERRRIFLSACQAYGFYDLEKVKKIALDSICEELKLGESIRLTPKGPLYRVIEINDVYATLDSNHPLAGQDLIFEVEATHVRVATPDEISEPMESPEQTLFH